MGILPIDWDFNTVRNPIHANLFQSNFEGIVVTCITATKFETI